MLSSTLPREKLLTVVQSLPAAPQILAKLGGLLLDMDSGLDAVADLLKPDAALTARILRIANSAAYTKGEPAASIDEALARVGFKEVYRLAGLAAVAQVSDGKLPFYGITGVQLRENALLTALIMERLAYRVEVDPRIAYTVGLLRSTGKIAIDRLAKLSAMRCSYDSRSTTDLAGWETSQVGFNNCEAAQLVLTEWNFPADIVAAIHEHYSPQNTGSPLAQLLNLSAGRADRAGHGLPGETLYWEQLPGGETGVKIDESLIEGATSQALDTFRTMRVVVA